MQYRKLLAQRRATVDEGKWASGRWQVTEGKADEFIQRWTAWMDEAIRSTPGFRSAKLLRAEGDPLRFTSISEWDDDATLKTWKASPEFRARIESVKALCDDFLGGDYDVVAAFPSRTAPGS
jgi:heme-degrading monooxygenase HmoA